MVIAQDARRSKSSAHVLNHCSRTVLGRTHSLDIIRAALFVAAPVRVNEEEDDTVAGEPTYGGPSSSGSGGSVGAESLAPDLESSLHSALSTLHSVASKYQQPITKPTAQAPPVKKTTKITVAAIMDEDFDVCRLVLARVTLLDNN